MINTGFKDIALIYGVTEQSYQETSQLINRIRHQKQDETPSRTLHESTEKEGKEVLGYIEERARCVLTENGFSDDGICQNIKFEYNNERPVTIAKEQIISAIDKCCRDKDISIENILKNPVPYENPYSSTQISIDDVNVKKQEEFRPGGKSFKRIAVEKKQLRPFTYIDRN